MAGAADAMGANLLQRTAKRRGHRNGIHMRLLATPASDIQRRIPSFRTGSVTLLLLVPRHMVEGALWHELMEA